MRATRIKKWLLYVVVGSLAAHFLAKYWFERDPYREEIEVFIKTNSVFTAQLGNINKIELYRLIAVDDSINIEDHVVPGYRVYHFSAEGSNATGRIVVNAKKRQSGEEMMFEIQSIEF